MTLEVREMQSGDVAACVEIINHIIRLGGTTAHEDPYDNAGFAKYYFEDPKVVNVALLDGRIVGFQAAFEAGEGVYSIGSFTDQQKPIRGVGAAMFDKTRADCTRLGGASIIAKITSDNSGGLAYYSKMGFQPDAI